jgi:hypothetical protein
MITIKNLHFEQNTDDSIQITYEDDATGDNLIAVGDTYIFTAKRHIEDTEAVIASSVEVTEATDSVDINLSKTDLEVAGVFFYKIILIDSQQKTRPIIKGLVRIGR